MILSYNSIQTIKSNSDPNIQCEIGEGKPPGHSHFFMPHFLYRLFGHFLYTILYCWQYFHMNASCFHKYFVYSLKVFIVYSLLWYLELCIPHNICWVNFFMMLIRKSNHNY